MKSPDKYSSAEQFVSHELSSLTTINGTKSVRRTNASFAFYVTYCKRCVRGVSRAQRENRSNVSCPVFCLRAVLCQRHA